MGGYGRSISLRLSEREFAMERTENCRKKVEWMNKSLRHQEPDRVPISDFFWGSFIERWKKDLGLPSAFRAWLPAG